MVLLGALNITWSIPFILFKIFGLNMYKITNPNKFNIAINKLSKKSTILDDDGDIDSFIWGFPYIGYVKIPNGGNNMKNEIYILTTEKYFKKITTNEEKISENDDNMIVVWEKYGGCFKWLQYGKRELNIDKSPMKYQKDIMSKIEEEYNKKSFATVYLHGKPNNGKSMIGLLLAKKLNASFCNEFNVIAPGDMLSELYSKVMPTKNKPLIIVLEEYDAILWQIHNGIKPHKEIPIQATNKSEINSLFDRINMPYYPNIIVIMTSNKHPDEIDKWDNSYLRNGRVNMKIHVKTD